MSWYSKFHTKYFTSKITLSERDAKVFLDAIENPPEPNDKLKQAIKDAKSIQGIYDYD